MTLDINTDLAAGTKDPSEVFSDIDANLDAFTLSELSTLGTRNYNALTGSIPDKKKVFGKLKKPKPARLSVINMKTGKYEVTSTKFILTAVRRDKREKFQATTGFGEEFLFSVFGKEISIYSISGTLMNLSSDGVTEDGHGMDWVRDMDEFYDLYLRAYKLVKENRQAVLHYSNRIIRGYIIGKIESDDSNSESYVNFNMSMVVRKDKMY